MSYNAPSKDTLTSDQLEQKSRRIGAMLQNYELQRRMHADALNVSSNSQKIIRLVQLVYVNSPPNILFSVVNFYPLNLMFMKKNSVKTHRTFSFFSI